MRFGIFSDLHLHNHKDFSRPLGMGMNSRAVNCLQIITQLEKVVEEKKLDVLLFCGDFWETRGFISVPLYDAARYYLTELAKQVPIAMIGGQHDSSVVGEDSINAISLFNDIDHIYTADVDPLVVSFGDCEILGRNAESGLVDFPARSMEDSNFRILLLHEMIKGARISSSYSAEAGITVEELNKYLRKNKIDACFIGDIHYRQKLGKLVYHVGSCIQKDFGERTQKKGMLIFDTDDFSVKFFQLHSPRFVSISYKRFSIKSVIGDNFYVVHTETDEEYEKAQEIKSWNIRIVPPKKNFQSTRSNIHIGLSDEEAIRKYVKIKIKKKVPREILTRLGLDLLKEASGDQV